MIVIISFQVITNHFAENKLDRLNSVIFECFRFSSDEFGFDRYKSYVSLEFAFMKFLIS